MARSRRPPRTDLGKTTVLLPPSLKLRASHVALDRNLTLSELIIEALERHLGSAQKGKSR
jgi:hypothetical protein